LLWAAGIFLLTFALSLAIFGAIVVALPANYFVEQRSHFWADKHPLIRSLGIISKNLLGMALIALGVVLSVPGIPGQGLLTILIGAMLLDIPGKHRLVRRFIHRPGVLRKLNRLRASFGRPPLEVDVGEATRLTGR
jgi:hypothetical protein